MTTLNQVYKAPKIQPGKAPKVKPANSLEHAPQAVQPTQTNMTSKPMTDNKDIYKLGSYQALQELGLEKHAFVMPFLRAGASMAKAVLPKLKTVGAKVLGTEGQVVSSGWDARSRAGDIGKGIDI